MPKCRGFEILEYGIGGPGIIAFVASAVVHAVQLSGLGRDIRITLNSGLGLQFSALPLVTKLS